METRKVYRFLYNDMEIDNIFYTINNTITTFGESQLRDSFNRITIGKSTFDLVAMVKYLHDDKKYNTRLESKLKFIGKHNNLINLWLTHPIYEELNFFGNLSYTIPYKIGNEDIDIFNNSIALTISNTFRFSTVLVQIIFYLVMYRMMLYLGRDMTLAEYMYSIAEGQYMSATFFLSFFTSNEIAIDYLAKIASGSYILNMFYSMYNTVMDCIVHYELCSRFRKEYELMIEIISTCKDIFDCDPFKSTLCDEITLYNIRNAFKILNSHFNYNKLLFGEIVMEGIRCDKFRSELTIICDYVGKLDVLLSNSKLLDVGYSSPIVDYTYTEPYIGAKSIWHPMLDYETQTKNSLSLGLTTNRTMIITGPNKAGKSTFMRSLILTIYFSQVLGVVCAEEFYFTPFTKIFTYLNVPDSIGKESLFEAELERCYVYHNSVMESMTTGDKIIGFIDELFTGTNYLEGMSGSYAIIKKISEIPTSMTILTTHYHEICDISNITYNKFCAIENTQNTTPKYTFTYKIEQGISDQCIALHLLQEKGYNDRIITLALEKLSKHKPKQTSN